MGIFRIALNIYIIYKVFCYNFEYITDYISIHLVEISGNLELLTIFLK